MPRLFPFNVFALWIESRGEVTSVATQCLCSSGEFSTLHRLYSCELRSVLKMGPQDAPEEKNCFHWKFADIEAQWKWNQRAFIFVVIHPRGQNQRTNVAFFISANVILALTESFIIWITKFYYSFLTPFALLQLVSLSPSIHLARLTPSSISELITGFGQRI